MRTIAGIAMAAAALLAAGCGADEGDSSRPRPPSPITLTAAITTDEVSLSPEEIAAGPVRLVVANQTTATQRITFRAAGDGADGFTQQTGPIDPGDTATLKADVPRGRVTVKVEGEAIEPAVLTVGAPRAKASDGLLQP